MAIASAATEADSLLLLAECRRCLAYGVDLKAYWIKLVINNLESATVNSLIARADITPSTALDARNDAEAAIVAA